MVLYEEEIGIAIILSFILTAEFVFLAGFAGAGLVASDFGGVCHAVMVCSAFDFGFVLRGGAGGWDCL